MADEDVDPELIELLRATLLGKNAPAPMDTDTRVLRDAEFVCDNAIDVAIDSLSTKRSAAYIWKTMQEQAYSAKTWNTHELHPKEKTEATVAFIFTMDLLNFSFWHDSSHADPFTVEYRGKSWTGYWSLVAALQRALDEDIPITDPHYWIDENECTIESMTHVFRSSTPTPIPMLEERLDCLRKAGRVLYEKHQCTFISCLESASCSAAKLVNQIVQDFDVFRDESKFEGKTVRFFKRAQIVVADIWACFEGQDFGQFDDIDKVTMFADYRVPQMLNSLGCLQYSPSLNAHIQGLKDLPSGHSWEVQLRGCSVWCVELIRKEILKLDSAAHVNAILIDFFLYDTVKNRFADKSNLPPHHRTRCIWY